MAPDAVTATRIYTELRHEIVGGRFFPEQSLVVRSLADEKRVSVAPLRDALNRLVGEGLLQLQPGGGFCLPTVDKTILSDLYDWHGRLIDLVLTDVGFEKLHLHASEFVDVHDDVAANSTKLFRRLSEITRNQYLRGAIWMTNDRLQSLRFGENCLSAIDVELEAIHGFLRGTDIRALRAALQRYHRRRHRNALRILAHIRGIVALHGRE